MGIKICPKCGGKVSTSRNVCIHCGYEFPSSKKCPDCGESVDINTKECPVCGYLFNEFKTVEPSASNTHAKEQNINQDAKSQNEVIDASVHSDDEPEVQPLLEEDKPINNDNNEFGESANNEAIESKSNEIAEDQKSAETAEPSNVNIEEEQESQSLECPYCHSHNLMPIGIDFFMCETCKGKFLNIGATSDTFIFSAPATENKKSDDILVESSSLEESHEEAHSKNVTKLNTIETEESSSGDKMERKPSVYAKPKESKPKKEKVHKPLSTKKKAWIITVSIVAFLGVVFGTLTGTVFVPKSKYDKAMSLLNSDPYEAYNIFFRCSWGDSSKQAEFAWARINFENKEDKDAVTNGVTSMCQNGGIVHVEYDVNGGSDVLPETLTGYGANVTATTSKSGYTFAGWQLTDYGFYNNNYCVNISLKAAWSCSDDFEFSVNGDGTFTLTGLKNQTLTEVRIPSENNGKIVSIIGDLAFAQCTSLTSVVIPSSVTTVGTYAFSGCQYLSSVTLNSGLSSIGFGAFRFCNSLTSVVIPNSVTTVGEKAFEYCENLTNVTLSNSMTAIAYHMFFYCSKLAGITITPSITTIIGTGTFYDCSFAKIYIPKTVTSISPGCFYGCKTTIYCEVESNPWGRSRWHGDNPVVWGVDYQTFLNS